MQFDLIIIGSGPSGQRAALQAAKVGKKAAIVESYSAMGGGCVHFGTLPSKSFRESIYRYSLGSRGAMASESDSDSSTKKKRKSDAPDMERLLRRRARVVSSESQVIFDQLKRNNVTLFHGRARLVSPTEVEIKSSKKTIQITSPKIVLAVGARPISPTHLPIDGKTVLDSDSILSLKKIPKTMTVLGAGIIGCEYASMFAMAGTKVFLVDRRHEILASVDREIVSALVSRFQDQGMEIILQAEAQKIEKLPVKRGLQIHLTNGKKIKTDVVLIAQGRTGNIEGLGLEEVGVQVTERGLIKVESHFQTSIPSIYAVGDVIGAPALASTAFEQGRIATRHALELGDSEMNPLFPYGIYTIPEISTIGLTEEELIAKKIGYVVGRARYKELARGQIVGDRWGLLKLLVDRKTLKLLGVHIIGDNAADLIHIGQAVMHFGGTVPYFIQSVFNYPTLAEAYKTAAFHAMNQVKVSS